jgi:uncharacterized Zn finger protein
MNDWEERRWFPRATKQPPPKHGIKIKKAGTTWWGKLWIDALREVLRGQPGRLERGGTYARAGRTHDLKVNSGKVTALVTGSRPKPYEVSIELRKLDDAVWSAAIHGMAQKAQFAAELLAGQMPTQIDDVFVSAGKSLFPRKREELETDCSCPDWGDPCKHVAATHYVLGEALDRDPFLLFELRGRTKEQVLSALRAARGGERAASTAGKRKNEALDVAELDHAPEVPTVKLPKLRADDYDKPREPLPSLKFSFEEPEAHGAVLRQLGKPAAWDREQSPAEVLAPLVRAAAENARRLAMAELPRAEPAPREAAPRAEKPAQRPVRRAKSRPKPSKRR